MNENRAGRIVAFYSFKGGVGRSLVLANVGWLLAANQQRVLVVDWDLEAPGLEEFFRACVPQGLVRQIPGVIDLLVDYRKAAEARLKKIGVGGSTSYDQTGK